MIRLRRTGTVPHALFREQEDAQGYFLLLREVIRSQGVPLAVYSDRHGIFQRSPKEVESLEEQLSGERQPTQFGQALRELGIQPIFALSPQAKGRIERFWGTFQDRLVSELRLAGARTLQEANKVLSNFLPRFNAHFGVAAAQEGSAYRQPEPILCLEGVLCFKYQRTVARDNTIRFDGHTLQLLPGFDRLSYAHARVELQQRLDGSLVVTYRGQTVATRQAPPQPVTLRACKGARGASTSTPLGLVGGVPPDNIGAQAESPRPDRGRSRVGLGPDPEEARLRAGPNYPHHKPAPNHPWRKPLLLTKSLNN